MAETKTEKKEPTKKFRVREGDLVVVRGDAETPDKTFKGGDVIEVTVAEHDKIKHKLEGVDGPALREAARKKAEGAPPEDRAEDGPPEDRMEVKPDKNRGVRSPK